MTTPTLSAQARTAVVLARGLGTRMRAASDDPAAAALTPAQAAAAASGYKALMPIGEHLLIDYSLSALADAGIERVVLVVGPEHEAFDAHLDHLRSTGALSRLTVELAVQDEPLGTADAVASAAGVVGEEPFVMVNGDNYYPVAGLRALAQAVASSSQEDGPARHALLGFDRAALVAGSNIPADRVAAFALVRAREGSQGGAVLEEILEKPSPEVVAEAGEHAQVSMNAFGFSPSVFAACREISPSPRGEYEIVDAVRHLVDSGEDVAVLPVAAGVLDLSRREDVADVQARLDGVVVSL